MLAIYEGQNQALKTAIAEFEHAYKMLLNKFNGNINTQVARVFIDNIEQRLNSVIESAIDGSTNDRQWFAASRREIETIYVKFDSVRENIGYPRDQYLQLLVDAIKDEVSNLKKAFAESGIAKHMAKLKGETYGLIVGAASATATGLSTLSFFVVPPVAPVITGTTAVVGVVATVGATIYGNNVGLEEGAERAEDAIRMTFKY